jgi:hypothetical protein
MDNHEPALNSSQELSRATVAWRALCITVLLFDALVVEFISPQNETVAPPWVHLTLAFATLALNGALLICANRVGSTRVSTRSRLLLFTSVLIAVSLAAHGWMLRSHWIHAVDIDDVADMPRIVAAGVSLLLEGHHPYQHVQVPWDVPMAYQPGMFLPHVIPGLIGVDTRQAAAVASVLVPALWIIGFGRRGAWALLATTLVCLPWLCAKNQVFMPTTVQTPTWWPWCALGALLFLDGRWRSAGILWGLAAASRQHVIGAVILLALHLLRRGEKREALGFSLAALLTLLAVYLPFLLAGTGAFHAMIIEPLEYNRAILLEHHLPTPPPELYQCMGFGNWLVTLPGFPTWMLPLQILVTVFLWICTWRWVKSSAAAVAMAGFALIAFNFLLNWPVYYLHVPPLILFSTVALHILTQRAPESETAALGTP